MRAAIRFAAAAEPLYGGPIELDGNVLDPELHAVLEGARRAGVDSIEGMEPVAARAHSARVLGLFDVAPRSMARVLDATAPGPAGELPVRIYQPHRGRAAMIVWLHGGGGVIGSIASYDAVARLLAERTGCTVASVEYRLAPEHPHPAAIDDAVATWRWAVAKAPSLGVAPGKIAVAGDSFGGYLSAWVERRTRGDAIRPALSVLIYPMTDLTMSSRSHQLFANGFLLTEPLLRWFCGHYCPDPAQRRAASPLHCDDHAGAAPTVVITAGFDPLRDEGRAYADRLSAAGSRVIYRCHHDQIHGFLGMTGGLRRAEAAVAALCADLVKELA